MDDLAALALARGENFTDAAKCSGWSVRTIERRMADSDFQAEVRRIRSRLVDAACGKLADGATAAVETLRSLLTAESESVRLLAARSILEICCKFREVVELESRLAELEGYLDAQAKEQNR